MALSRLGASADFAALLAKSSSHAATSSSLPRHRQGGQLHASVARQYPEAPTLALPTNVSEIFNAETSRFAPERSRDLTAPCLLHMRDTRASFQQPTGNFTSSTYQPQDAAHLDSYDCFGAVSLSGAMQTNVPKPFCSTGKSMHLNMPGGQWARDNKYIAEDMRRSHFNVYKMRQLKRLGGLDDAVWSLVIRNYATSTQTSSDEKKEPNQQQQPVSNKISQDDWMKLSKPERLKIIIRDYGRTVIVFHVAISLASLGIFYGLVSSGLDLTPLLEFIGSNGSDAVEEVSGKTFSQKILTEGSTFVVAYAIHKIFAPIRISTTLICTPAIVKYLRYKGILKPPKINAVKVN